MLIKLAQKIGATPANNSYVRHSEKFPLTQENIFRVNSKIDQDIADFNKIAKSHN